MSLSARRAWIEIMCCTPLRSAPLRSLSARRAWIEILVFSVVGVRHLSLSARRAWIEIGLRVRHQAAVYVALRKESVD